MAEANLLTAGKIAEAVGASPAAVKKAIQELKLKPAAVKGPCNYYDADALKKIKAKVAK
jgi:biotin operon repressor